MFVNFGNLTRNVNYKLHNSVTTQAPHKPLWNLGMQPTVDGELPIRQKPISVCFAILSSNIVEMNFRVPQGTVMAGSPVVLGLHQ